MTCKFMVRDPANRQYHASKCYSKYSELEQAMERKMRKNQNVPQRIKTRDKNIFYTLDKITYNKNVQTYYFTRVNKGGT